MVNPINSRDALTEDLLSRSNPNISDRGSFTGQDIKAVVHLPINTQSANDAITVLENQRNALVEDIRARRVRNEGQIEAINTKIQQYQQFISEGVLPARILAELSSISYSIHREKFPVRSLGSVYPIDYTKGPRTIAGTLVFTVFNRHVLNELLDASTTIISTGVTGQEQDQHNMNSPVLTDQIPPFDVTIAYNNELGESSHMVIYGVEIVNEGQVTSVHDMITENEMQYVARDIDLMRSLPGRNLVNNIGVGVPRTPKDLQENDADFQRVLRRRNPFL